VRTVSKKNKELNTLFSIMGIAIGIIISSMYFLSFTMYLLSVGIAISLAFILYILINKRSEFFLEVHETKEMKTVYKILFFNIFSISVFVLHFSEVRPNVYFILISLCAMILSISILYVDSKKEILFQILQIFMISLSLIYSIYYYYSCLPLSDSSSHLIMNNQLATNGDINVLWDKETDFPLMHLQVAITKILLNCNIIDASNIAIILPFIISSMCIYLVVRSFFDEKMALLSLLILNINEMVGFDTLSKYSSNMISDYQFGRTTLEIKLGLKNATINNQDQINSENNTIFLWRKYTLNRPVRVSRTLTKNYDINYVKLRTNNEIFGNKFHERLNKYDKVYDNNKIIGCYLIN